MSGDLLLTVGVERVLRRGTPIDVEGWGRSVAVNVVRTTPGVQRGFVRHAPDAAPDEGDLVMSDFDGIAVDLSDATGRAHVAWAVASRFGEVDPNAPGECLISGVFGGDLLPTIDVWCAEVPELQALHNDDETRLPDGSRRIDAVALRLVAERVLGAA